MKVKYSLKGENGFIYNGFFYFIASNYPWIIGMDIKTYETTLIAVLPNEWGELVGQYIMGGCYNKKIVLIPRHGTRIIEYNLSTGKFWYMDIGDMGLNFDHYVGRQHIRFRSVAQDNEFLWIFPASCHHILCYNIERRKLDDYTEWYEQLKQYKWENVTLFGFGKKHKNLIILPCFQTNAIVVFDIVTSNCEIIRIGNMNNRFTCVELWNDNIFLIDNKNREIIVWDINQRIILKHHLFPSTIQLDEKFSFIRFNDYLISDLQVLDDKIICIVANGDTFWGIDSNGTMKKLMDKPSGESYLHGCVGDNALFCISQSGSEGICLEKDGRYKTFSLNILLDSSIVNQFTIEESYCSSLKEYIGCLTMDTAY